MEQPHLPQPVEESIDDIYPNKKDSDSGVGSDNGDKRLSATEPSDEDTISFNVPMSDIVEEDQVIKEDSGHHANSRKGWNVKKVEAKNIHFFIILHIRL